MGNHLLVAAVLVAYHFTMGAGFPELAGVVFDLVVAETVAKLLDDDG